jgi:3-hydroxyacyl-CoA dehydrogenase
MTQDVAAYMNEATTVAWEIDGLASGTNLRDVKSVGVIGAGTMGGGISMNFASIGIPVLIIETQQDALDRGLGIIQKNYQRSADRGRFPQEEVANRMANISGSLNMEDLSSCDLIIEAVFEDLELKKSIFARLDKIAKPGAILATNTSGLNIDEIAHQTSRPADVIGLHFFSPANVMKLLEIVRADDTSDEVVATSMDLAKRIGKIAALVGVCPGFVGNRILAYRQIQAAKLVDQGVMPWDVDRAFNEFGFKMGPFQMSDLAGLDIGWKKGAKTNSPIRDALCEMDRRGQKTGAGYYDYDENFQRQPSEVTTRVIEEVTGVKAGTKNLSSDEIIELCVYPMINEAVKILEENKAQRPSDIDVIWTYGYGWPSDKGGPIFYGDIVGAKTILDKLEEISATDEAFAPCQTLRDLAESGGKFVDISTGGLKTGS